MSLIEFKVDPALFTRLTVAVERLADGLDRLVPPIVLRGGTKPARPENLHVVTNEGQWAQEREQERRRDLGLPPEEVEPVEEPEDVV